MIGDDGRIQLPVHLDKVSRPVDIKIKQLLPSLDVGLTHKCGGVEHRGPGRYFFQLVDDIDELVCRDVELFLPGFIDIAHGGVSRLSEWMDTV
jgi:hypothetical protein